MTIAGHFLNGAVYGTLLLLLASGLALIYGLRRVINFAHGGFYAAGGYLGWAVAQMAGFWWGLAASAFLLAPAGYLFDRLCLSRLRQRDPLTTLIVTFGLLLVIEDAILIVWGKDARTLAEPWPFDGAIALFGADFPAYRLFVVALGIAVGAGLQLWLRGSRSGLFVRAAGVDPLTTGMHGVDADRLGALVVAVGCALAGLAGFAATPLLSLSPTVGASVIIDCFIVVIIGGLGSIAGAVAAALLLGQLQAWGAVLVPELAALLPVLAMAAVLAVRPAGLAGGRT